MNLLLTSILYFMYFAGDLMLKNCKWFSVTFTNKLFTVNLKIKSQWKSGWDRKTRNYIATKMSCFTVHSQHSCNDVCPNCVCDMCLMSTLIQLNVGLVVKLVYVHIFIFTKLVLKHWLLLIKLSKSEHLKSCSKNWRKRSYSKSWNMRYSVLSTCTSEFNII